MKKTFFIIFALVCIFSNPIISYACQNPQKSFPEKVSAQIADLGNGITMESTITEYHKNSRSKTRTAVKTSTCKANGKTIATIELTATFTYTGSSAVCTNASSTYSMSDGWSYKNRSTTRSKNTATTKARLTNGINYSDIGVTMTCSKTGEIS